MVSDAFWRMPRISKLLKDIKGGFMGTFNKFLENNKAEYDDV